jgi:hypothetical protein
LDAEKSFFLSLHFCIRPQEPDVNISEDYEILECSFALPAVNRVPQVSGTERFARS